MGEKAEFASLAPMRVRLDSVQSTVADYLEHQAAKTKRKTVVESGESASEMVVHDDEVPGPSGLSSADVLASGYTNENLERYMLDEYDEFMQIAGGAELDDEMTAFEDSADESTEAIGKSRGQSRRAMGSRDDDEVGGTDSDHPPPAKRKRPIHPLKRLSRLKQEHISTNQSFLFDKDDEVDENLLLGIPLELRTKEAAPQVAASEASVRPYGESAARRKANKAVDALIGQANVLYARGQKREARILLLEAIREEPRNPEPYRQVSDIYKEMDQPHESLQYGLLAAHLHSRTTPEQWSDLGDLACKLGRNEEAAACYGRAMRLEPTNWMHYEKRISLLDQIGLGPLAMRTRLLAAQQIDQSSANVDFNWFQTLIKTVAEYYIQLNDESRAMEALEAFVLRSREFGKNADAQHNTLIGMWMSKGRYEDAAKSVFALCQGIAALDEKGKFVFEIRYDHAGYTIKPFPPPKIHRYAINNSLSTSLLARLTVCFIRMGRPDLIPGLVEKLNERHVEPNDEAAFLMIPQAHMAVEHYLLAQKYLEHLLTQSLFGSSADAHFLYGQVLTARKKFEEAAVAFKRVLELQPSHVDARIRLSTIQQRLGLTEQAFETLRDYDLDAGSSIPDERLLVRQADFLYEQKRTSQFVRCVRMLLAPHFHLVHQNSTLLRRRSNVGSVSNGVRTVALNSLHGSQMEKYVKRLGSFAIAEDRALTGLTGTQLHDYCFKLLEIFLDQNRYVDALHVCCYAYLQPVICKTRKTMETFENLLLHCAMRARQWTLAFEYLRWYFTKSINNHPLLIPSNSDLLYTRVFNCMNYVFCHSQNVSYHRYIMRALVRLPSQTMCGKKSLIQTALRVISGNNSLITGAYRHALSEYLRVWFEFPEDPLMCLLVSLTFVHMACKKDINSRHMIALRGLAFMKQYEKLRGPCQETYYNIARMFHQMNILPMAIHFYEKCLKERVPKIKSVDPDTRNEIIADADRYDLRPMAAHNLAMIYQTSGNMYKAIQLLKDYCVIE